MQEAQVQDEKPTCIIAKTVKGSGVSLLANKEGWHGKALSPAQAREAIHELGGERHLLIYIAEQQLVSAALGLSVLGKIAFAATFAAFFTRAFDQIRMAAISDADLRLCGSHAGVSIGEDGPSQMALEDLAMMQAVHGSTVLYPCDANQTAWMVAAMADLPGISYLRLTRAKTPVLYAPGETFAIGGSKLVRHSDSDQVTIVAAGITLHESLRAYEQLKSEGIPVRVMDAYSVKPIDTEALHLAAQVTAGRFVVVEDHWSQGGFGDAVLDAFAGGTTMPLTVVKLAVHSIPTSGSAMPLVWAHAEYLKLQRSLKDGRVFDMPPQTVQRYLTNKTVSPRMVWRFNHKLRSLPAGKMLRIETLSPARIHWSADNWTTLQDVTTQDLGLGIYIADLPTQSLSEGEQTCFTFYWPDADHWQGADFCVHVGAAQRVGSASAESM